MLLPRDSALLEPWRDFFVMYPTDRCRCGDLWLCPASSRAGGGGLVDAAGAAVADAPSFLWCLCSASKCAWRCACAEAPSFAWTMMLPDFFMGGWLCPWPPPSSPAGVAGTDAEADGAAAAAAAA
eukprot:Rhum_TRINITY_DN15411_c18_g1::Rhum_TRINITY_DN15411_c18_g1_i1::g.156206::m.156206